MFPFRLSVFLFRDGLVFFRFRLEGLAREAHPPRAKSWAAVVVPVRLG